MYIHLWLHAKVIGDVDELLCDKCTCMCMRAYLQLQSRNDTYTSVHFVCEKAYAYTLKWNEIHKKRGNFSELSLVHIVLHALNVKRGNIFVVSYHNNVLFDESSSVYISSLFVFPPTCSLDIRFILFSLCLSCNRNIYNNWVIFFLDCYFQFKQFYIVWSIDQGSDNFKSAKWKMKKRNTNECENDKEREKYVTLLHTFTYNIYTTDKCTNGAL